MLMVQNAQKLCDAADKGIPCECMCLSRGAFKGDSFKDVCNDCCLTANTCSMLSTMTGINVNYKL